MNEQAKRTFDKMGGEPLKGSGFEDETPEEGFSEEVASDAQTPLR